MSLEGFNSCECLHISFSQSQEYVLQGGCVVEQLVSTMQLELLAFRCAISKEALHDWPHANIFPCVCGMWKESVVCLSAICPRSKWTFSMHLVPSGVCNQLEKIFSFSSLLME